MKEQSSSPSSGDEATHMQLLREYQILDSEPEQSFDDITELVSLVSNFPFVAIVFFDIETPRAWVKSAKGLRAGDFPLDLNFYKTRANNICGENVFVEYTNEEIPEPLQQWNITYMASFPVCCPQGLTLGDLAVCDTKHRKLSEEQIENILKLSRQVTNLVELRKTVHLLEEANKDKSGFMGVISHDIRQPLGNIMLSCELLADKVKEEDSYLVQTIHSSAGLMQHLVDDMLHMVKMDLGKLEVTLEKRSVDLGKLVATVVQAHRSMAERKNITIEYSILNCPEQGSCTPWEVLQQNRPVCGGFLLDPLRIEQVINNLLSNAIKFSYPRSKVEVFGEKKDGEGTVEITIKDNGKGIPASDMSQLFTAFSRLSVKPTAGESSTGLGLCIVKSIVEAHRGNIIVESTVGKGTTFKIILPVRVTPTPLRRSSSDRPVNRFNTVTKQQLRILLADDNRVNQHLVSQVLSKRGHLVTTADDGVEALKVFEREEEHKGYDVLLIDEEMPHMKGREVIEKIRYKEKSIDKHIPIIAISGHVGNEFKDTMIRIGADHVVAKPFRIQNLISIVEQYSSRY